MRPTEVFILLLTVQMFYGFGITLLTYSFENLGVSINEEMQQYIVKNVSKTEDVSAKLQESLSLQTNIPILDMGALIFYTGNIIIDLMLNFFTAVPSMLTIPIEFITRLFNLNPIIASHLKLFIFGIATIFYFYMLLRFIMDVRRGGGLV